ncbi:ER membrane protein complex subunit 8/9 homolog [Osmia bicornis bicornis]|uniref:ER membrane protein complex subunit 8/9 homolog n=1 Tax=Osmia bicornis bicornis TaxID=1437191 RepID=UPI0010F62C0A|nr:ER membrane protein complex subunit 8/9 homolog [Osmia bicornis bicornis]
MADISFSSRAYCKIILHAAKYPHCAINGLLLAKQNNKTDGKSGELRIEDAIPLFHICLHVSPMAEIALTMVDQYAGSKGLILAGYYFANENINDLSTDKPAHKIADKIAENNGNALLVAVDNKEVTLSMNSNPLRVSQYIDGKWKLKDITDVYYDKGVMYTDALYSLLKAEHYKNLIDFDNHLDDISLNWQNCKINKIIDEIVEKYK